MDHWFVMYVKSTYEDEIAQLINDLGTVHAFVPRKVKLHKRQGKIIKFNEIVFKSYVFVETDMDYKTFSVKVLSEVKMHSAYFKTLLHHDDKNMETLYPQEKAFLQSFMNDQHIIEESIGFVEGDAVTILSGPLMGNDSIITKINKHKRVAYLNVSLMGRDLEIQVPLTIIYKK